MDKNTARVKVAICAGGGGSIDTPPPILYAFSMTRGVAMSGNIKNTTFFAKSVDTHRAAVIIEHRTQNTEHRTQNTEHRTQNT
ncbi:MAG: hypothetical protein K2I74_07115, partial [Treponemataceae bacterium]|nr:hypothetical protein [Treponemataceae bacterium]